MLGPLLFIMYINDIGKYLNESSVSLNADDTVLYTTGSSQVGIMLTLRIQVRVINEWLKANHLTLDVYKTKYVIFGSWHSLRDRPNEDPFTR